MANNKVRWGILGTSPISETMARAISASNISELIAIGSRCNKTGKRFADKFSIPKHHQPDALLHDTDIDAIYLGLPNHLHKEWVIRCARAGKHILCEKPFVLNAQEADAAFAEVEKAGVVCMEALMYRYHPLTLKLQELIQSNILGDIKLINATYSANIAAVANSTAGGSIRNLGCYPISLVRLLLNAEPIAITALGRIGDKNDNQASAILKFPNNTMAVVSTADDINMYWQFDMYGSNGCLKMLSNPWMPQQNNNKILVHLNAEKTSVEINVQAEKPLYTYQFDTVSNKILNQPLVTEITRKDSVGNVNVLEQWLSQIQ